MGALSQEAVYAALAVQWRVESLQAADIDLVDAAASLPEMPVPARWLLERRVLPWRTADGRWHLAADDLLDVDVRESLAAAPDVGEPVWHLMLPAELDRCLTMLREGTASRSQDAQALRAMAEDAPVIAFVNNLLAQAVEARASDIHIEPGERDFDVRLRIDGVLHDHLHMPMERFAATASRIKLIGHLDIAERRLPQDGHIGLRVAGAEIDVRVSAIPAVHGESLVLRLLPKQRADLALDSLGMTSDHLQTFGQWLQWPNGLLLVTGPTGSGKSTTLYSALSRINDGARKIVTVEDPVEQRLPRVVQIQTHAEIGYTFARALRAILRHDPDIVMIGEIRDRETAEIAIQAALTGHLVLATLHTNDALSAISRLVDMGVEPYLVAAALRAVMAQRLVRRLCEACASDDPAPAQVLLDAWRRTGSAATPHWRQPAGCPQCQGTGFRGRVGIYELVTITPELQQAVAAQSTIAEIERIANGQGRRSLFADGVLKVGAGLSTLPEVLQASGAGP
ncbi:MAG: GspE/PulE family protein [Rubrivivax sp.]|nr:GspE/PulE family protein [Rubrivivax sp.]